MINAYLRKGTLRVEVLGRGLAGLETLAAPMKNNGYGQYLLKLLKDRTSSPPEGN